MSNHVFRMDITFECNHPTNTVFDSICLSRRAIKELLDKNFGGDYNILYKIDMQILEMDKKKDIDSE
jgi:hypothetical protein